MVSNQARSAAATSSKMANTLIMHTHPCEHHTDDRPKTEPRSFLSVILAGPICIIQQGKNQIDWCPQLHDTTLSRICSQSIVVQRSAAVSREGDGAVGGGESLQAAQLHLGQDDVGESLNCISVAARSKPRTVDMTQPDARANILGLRTSISRPGRSMPKNSRNVSALCTCQRQIQRHHIRHASQRLQIRGASSQLRQASRQCAPPVREM